MIPIALSVLLSVSLAGPAFAQGVSTSIAAPPPAAGGGGGSLPAALSPMGASLVVPKVEGFVDAFVVDTIEDDGDAALTLLP